MAHQADIPATVVTGSNHNNDIALAENKFGFQDKLYSRTQNKNNQLSNLVTKILKTSTSYNQGIHPRIFCRRWFGFDAIKEDGRPRFTEEQIVAMEAEHGYREQCINLISRLLKIKPNTIHRWGKGVTFDKIPADKREKYEMYLGYVDSIRIMTESLAKLDENSLLKLWRKLEDRSEN